MAFCEIDVSDEEWVDVFDFRTLLIATNKFVEKNKCTFPNEDNKEFQKKVKRSESLINIAKQLYLEDKTNKNHLDIFYKAISNCDRGDNSHLVLVASSKNIDVELQKLILKSQYRDVIAALINNDSCSYSTLEAVANDGNLIAKSKIKFINDVAAKDAKLLDRINSGDYNDPIEMFHNLYEDSSASELSEAWDEFMMNDISIVSDEICLYFLSHKNLSFNLQNQIIDDICRSINFNDVKKTGRFLLRSNVISDEWKNNIKSIAVYNESYDFILENKNYFNENIVCSVENIIKEIEQEKLNETLIQNKNQENKIVNMLHTSKEDIRGISFQYLDEEKIQLNAPKPSMIKEIFVETATKSLKSAAAQIANEKLVELAQIALIKSKILPEFIIDTPEIKTVLSLVGPALIMLVASTQEDFLKSQVGEKNIDSLKELSKIAFEAASAETIKPLISNLLPTIKSLIALPALKEQLSLTE